MALKKEYMDKLHAQLNEWNEKIAALEKELDKTKEKVKSDSEDFIEVLRPEIKIVESKMAEIRDSSGAFWEELEEGLENALDDLKQSYEKVRRKIKSY